MVSCDRLIDLNRNWTMSKIRERFEAWHKIRYGYVGSPADAVVHEKWIAFQAGNQSALEPVRELEEKWHSDAEDARGERDYETAEAIDKCRRELAKLLEE